MVSNFVAIILMGAQWSGGAVVHPAIAISIGSPSDSGAIVSNVRHGDRIVYYSSQSQLGQ